MIVIMRLPAEDSDSEIPADCRRCSTNAAVTVLHQHHYELTWTPGSDVTPMNRNTPYKTGIGIS